MTPTLPLRGGAQRPNPAGGPGARPFGASTSRSRAICVLCVASLTGCAMPRPPQTLSPPQPLADVSLTSVESWRYAKWGMSPDEIVAASRGKAMLLASASNLGASDRQRIETTAKQNGVSPEFMMRFKGAASSMENGGIFFDISFMFNARTGGLVNVLVHKDLCDQTEATRIRLALDSAYGKPFEDYAFYDLMKMTKWKARNQLVEFAITNDRDSKAHSCMISYEPFPMFSSALGKGENLKY